MGTAKCDGNGCELRDRCYRFTSKSTAIQSWLVPECPGMTCEHHIPNDIENKQKRTCFIIEKDDIIEKSIRPN